MVLSLPNDSSVDDIRFWIFRSRKKEGLDTESQMERQRAKLGLILEYKK